MDSIKEATIFFDGGIRQGVMALGFIAYDMNGTKMFSGNRLCGKLLSSSNVAEYRALIAGLQEALKQGIDVIHVIGDSQLVVKQILGVFKTKKPQLIEHRDFALKLLEEFNDWTIKWIPRTENKRADALVNEVFDRRKATQSHKKRRTA